MNEVLSEGIYANDAEVSLARVLFRLVYQLLRMPKRER